MGGKRASERGRGGGGRGGGGGKGRTTTTSTVQSRRATHRGREKDAKDADAATPQMRTKTGHATDQEGSLQQRRAATASQAAVRLWRGRRAALTGRSSVDTASRRHLQARASAQSGGGKFARRCSAHPSGSWARGRRASRAAPEPIKQIPRDARSNSREIPAPHHRTVVDPHRHRAVWCAGSPCHEGGPTPPTAGRAPVGPTPWRCNVRVLTTVGRRWRGPRHAHWYDRAHGRLPDLSAPSPCGRGAPGTGEAPGGVPHRL